jgi:hypothetical protein
MSDERKLKIFRPDGTEEDVDLKPEQEPQPDRAGTHRQHE